MISLCEKLRNVSVFLDMSCRQLSMRHELEQTPQHSAELDMLQRLLHFPEEVARRLTEVEYMLFQKVSPLYYVRQVTMDLSKNINSGKERKPSVQDLMQRFNEVRILPELHTES